jgi:prefoldin alpha subunit
MDEHTKRDALETLAAEASYHQRQAQDIQGQMQTLQSIETEMSRTMDALKNLKEKRTTLFNLGSGIFVKGEMKETNKLLLNIGSNVLAEKDAESAIKFLEEKKSEISQAKEEMMQGMQSISDRLREIDIEARRMMGEGE